MSYEIMNTCREIFGILQLIVFLFARQIYYIFYDISFIFTHTTEQKPKRTLEAIALKLKESLEVQNRDLSGNHVWLKTTDKEVSFSLKRSAVVVTDIIGSTRLYDEEPLKMKYYMIRHQLIIRSIMKNYDGRIVLNEGDSFHIVFKNIELATRFCEEFFNTHNREIPFFRVRLGINKGENFCVRNLCGYKIFGKPIDEIQEIFKHNNGTRACIKRRLIPKNSSIDHSIFCVH